MAFQLNYSRAGFACIITAMIVLGGCGGNGSSGSEPPPPTPQKPTVSIAKPLATAAVASTSIVTVTANVSVASGASATEVALFRNDELVAIDNEAPYEWAVENIPAGLQTLMVRVTDSNDQTAQATRTLSVVDTSIPNEDVVWAINAGGDEFISVDGIEYAADAGFTGGATRQISADIKATHNPTLYKSERFGEAFSYAHDIDNGSYNLTLRFAETAFNARELRKFSVMVEGEQRLTELDVHNIAGAAATVYDVTIPNIDVADGQINIEFQAVLAEAVLSALVVSKPRAFNVADWTLIWSDEFNYEGAPDPDKWNYEVRDPGWVNNELQRYTTSLDNTRVNGEVLIIEGRKNGDEYTSGRIHSQGKGDILYGRIEARAKLPAGRGTWPAIWMMPTDYFGYGNGWPDSGEIDIMEFVGYDPGHIHATTHNRAYYWVNGLQRKGSVRMADVTDEFHVYAVEWDEEKMNFFIDDILYFTYVNDHRGWESWPFDKSFHVILNLAIGGNWGGALGVDPDIWPVHMEVDYLRMYQR